MNRNMTTVSLVESNSAPNGHQLVNSYQTNRNSDPMDLVQLAQVVEKGDQFVRATAGSKLTVIADQIRYLQEQAKKVLIDAKRDQDLHHAACNLVRKPGTVYHLYERDSGQVYFSILSPAEWGPACPHEFLGSFKLEHDMSWTEYKDIEKRGQDFAMIDKILNTQLALTESSQPNFDGLIKSNSNPDIKELPHESVTKHVL
ncbi:unnamed protein product [Owenia fusiformis]|uniref:Uncharacterized protein n=1 Tax=Owenia fusiformis TaxID=6347 RepID=A0A8J1Y9I5_OWEFU|nr:unnamed protein product [Owenia fusiformis]